jgi:hypothetical protein
MSQEPIEENDDWYKIMERIMDEVFGSTLVDAAFKDKFIS